MGATKVSQLEENLKTIDVTISQQGMQHLHEISKTDLGFPGEFFNEEAVRQNNFGGFFDRIEKR